MKTLYLKMRPPIYSDLEPCGLDLVGFADAACTQELCVWPEFCSDSWPVDKTRIRHLGIEYEISWADPRDRVRTEMLQRWLRGEPSNPPHTGMPKRSLNR